MLVRPSTQTAASDIVAYSQQLLCVPSSFGLCCQSCPGKNDPVLTSHSAAVRKGSSWLKECRGVLFRTVATTTVVAATTIDVLLLLLLLLLLPLLLLVPGRALCVQAQRTKVSITH